MASKLAICGCWLLALLCVLPALVMLLGTLLKNGAPSLEHLRHAFGSPGRLLVLLGNSLAVAGATVGVALGLGAPLGFLCFRTDLPGRRAWVLAAILGACVPVYVTGTAWMALLGAAFWFTLDAGPAKVMAAGWLQGLAYVPAATLVCGMCFAAVDRKLEELARLDVGGFGVFRRVSLPRGAWGLAVAGIVVMVLSFTDITISDILLVRTFPEESFTQFQLQGEPWAAAALALPVIVLLAGLGLVGWRLVQRHGLGADGEAQRPPEVFKLGHWRWPLAGLAGVLALLFFAVPFVALVLALGRPAALLHAWRATSREVLYTLTVAPVAATLCAGLALVGGWAVLRLPRGRWAVIAGMLLLLATPAPVIGMGLVFLLNRPGVWGRICDSRAVLVWAGVARAAPFALLACLPALRRIPAALEDAARAEGASWLQRLRLVVVPLAWRAILIAWLLAFILVAGEIGASVIAAPPGHTVLSIRFFTLIHYGVYPDAAGICLILLLGVVLPGAAAAFLLWRALRERYV